MPSKAYNEHLEVVLADATELITAHSKIKTGQRGRQWGLGALNRAVVVMCVSAWEAYIEEVIREAIEAIHPGPGIPPGSWPSLKASALSEVGRLNTPNTQNIRRLVQNTIGMTDLTTNWSWKNCSSFRAITSLDKILKIRHEAAHGVRPRPVVDNKWALWAIGFIRRIAGLTDNAILEHITNTLGVNPPPWSRYSS